MKRGDHLVSPRTGYTHHGLYIGNGEVIHYSGFANGYSSGEITTTSVEAFSNGKGIAVQKHPNRKHDREDSVNRAFSRLGEDWYNVLINNCEHFVTWCIEGFHSSSQVNNAISTIALAHDGYRAFSTVKATPILYDVLIGSTEKEVIRQAVKIAAPKIVESSLASTTVGTLASVTTLGTSSVTTSVLSSIVAGGVGLSSAPVLGTVAAAVAVGYGVKKLFDWVND